MGFKGTGKNVIVIGIARHFRRLRRFDVVSITPKFRRNFVEVVCTPSKLTRESFFDLGLDVGDTTN